MGRFWTRSLPKHIDSLLGSAWGTCAMVGANTFGQILMQIPASIQAVREGVDMPFAAARLDRRSAIGARALGSYGLTTPPRMKHNPSNSIDAGTPLNSCLQAPEQRDGAQPFTMPAIFVFDPIGKYACLSNFFESVLELDGRIWPTVEHYFQAQKFVSLSEQEAIRSAPTAAEAKRRAWRHVEIRSDWDKVRDEVMSRGLAAKFAQHQDAQAALLGTWPLPILEDSMIDSYWGIGATGAGENRLGKILMKLRGIILNVHDEIDFPAIAIRPVHRRDSRETIITVDSFARLPTMGNKSSRSIKPSALTKLSIQALMSFELDHGECGRQISLAIMSNPDLESLRQRLSLFPIGELSTGLLKKVARARDRAFDKKYSFYRWSDDARAIFPDWTENFRDFLLTNFGAASTWEPALVLGAGAGEEAANIWREYGQHVILCDIGPRLTANCRAQAPLARVVQLAAEKLDGIEDESIGLYCALRTFESVYFDTHAAVAEAWRIVRPGGGVVISVSNGYHGNNGRFVRGRFIGETLDLGAAIRNCTAIAAELKAIGFEDIGFRDFETEYLIFGRKAVRPA